MRGKGAKIFMPLFGAIMCATACQSATSHGALVGQIPLSQSSQLKDLGCEPGSDDRRSELCADWKAADAAFASARWAWWQLAASIVGLIFTAMTMIAAVFAAVYAKRAAIATEGTVDIARLAAKETIEAMNIASKNADAAVRLADITESYSRNQFRPFFWVMGAGIEAIREIGFEVVLDIRCSGIQPGIVRSVRYSFMWMTLDGDIEVLNRDNAECEFVCAPGATTSLPIRTKAQPVRSEESGIFSVICEVFYEDMSEGKFSSPGSFQTSVMPSFGHLDSGTPLQMMSHMLVPPPWDDEQA